MSFFCSSNFYLPIFLMCYSDICKRLIQPNECADPEGGEGGPPPPGQSQVLWVSIENKQLDSPPPWKKLDPFWTLENYSFL